MRKKSTPLEVESAAGGLVRSSKDDLPLTGSIQLKMVIVFLIMVVAYLILKKDVQYSGIISTIIGMFFAILILSLTMKIKMVYVFPLTAIVFITFLISKNSVLNYYAPLLIVMLLPYFKTSFENSKNRSFLEKKFSNLEKERQNLETKDEKLLSQVNELKSLIKKQDNLYELSKDMEKVSSSKELAKKALETFSLKLGIERIAFFKKVPRIVREKFSNKVKDRLPEATVSRRRRTTRLPNPRLPKRSGGQESGGQVSNEANDDYTLVASLQIQIDEISRWKEKLERIKNMPGKHFFEFPLYAENKKMAAIILEGELDSSKIASANVIASQVALGYEKTLLYEKVEELSRVDGLTQLYRRKYFMARFEEEITRAKRYHYKVAFLLFDLDDFKKYNDTYGHPMGDQILSKATSVIRNNIYISDFAGRYGGEEFCVFIPHANRIKVRKTAEKIRSLTKKETTVTISAGISFFPDNASNLQQLIKNADVALYRAKALGKNCIQEYI